MSVMRVEKNSNYTVMANYHLRDKGISLKAKGLLSVMLSLPAEWDYTLAGLAHISKEGVDAIGTAVKELEHAGYVVRTRRRNEAGQLLDTDYPGSSIQLIWYISVSARSTAALADSKIQLKSQQMQKLRERLLSLSAPMDKEQVSHTPNVGIMAETIATIVDKQKEIDRENNELTKKKCELIELSGNFARRSATALLKALSVR